MFVGTANDVMVRAGEAIKILAVEQGRQGEWSGVVKKFFLPTIFDINPLAKKYSSCIIAHMKLSGTSPGKTPSYELKKRKLGRVKKNGNSAERINAVIKAQLLSP